MRASQRSTEDSDDKKIGFFSSLLERFCQMKGFYIKWEKSDGYNGKDWNSHTLTVANGHTFQIRHIREIVYPGTNIPTYIDTTYITPTGQSYEECCKKIITTSLGKWWTGRKVVSGKELKKLPPGCNIESRFLGKFSFQFPSSVEQLELLLTISGY